MVIGIIHNIMDAKKTSYLLMSIKNTYNIEIINEYENEKNDTNNK